MKQEELQCKTDSRDSFHGKAILIHDEDCIKGERVYISKLKSYNTIVAEYNHNTNKITIFGWYSSTTARHINEFLQYYGFDKMTKKEIIACEEKRRGGRMIPKILKEKIKIKMKTQNLVKEVEIEWINWLTEKVKFVGYEMIFTFDEISEVS